MTAENITEVANSSPVSDKFWQIPVQMGRIASSGSTPTSVQIDALRDYLDLRTVDFLPADETKRFARSQTPGYLETFSSNRRVLVPFQLAPFFPTEEVLGTAVDLAARVAVVATNPICISGSTTFLQALPGIGDLDYCEYHLGDPALLPAPISRKTHLQTADLLLVEVKCGTKHHHPWDKLEEQLGDSAKDTPEGKPFKLDFISDTMLGLLPTTSVILPVRNDPEGENAARSFTFQEAVIVHAEPPRSLLHPESMGRYLLWLLEDAARWLGDAENASMSKRGPKALKRLLSAALLLGESRLVEELAEGLAHSVVKEATMAGRLAELETMMESLPQDAAASYVSRLAAIRESITFGPNDIEAAMEEILDIGKSVLEELYLLLKEGGEGE